MPGLLSMRVSLWYAVQNRLIVLSSVDLNSMLLWSGSPKTFDSDQTAQYIWPRQFLSIVKGSFCGTLTYRVAHIHNSSIVCDMVFFIRRYNSRTKYSHIVKDIFPFITIAFRVKSVCTIAIYFASVLQHDGAGIRRVSKPNALCAILHMYRSVNDNMNYPPMKYIKEYFHGGCVRHLFCQKQSMALFSITFRLLFCQAICIILLM